MNRKQATDAGWKIKGSANYLTAKKCDKEFCGTEATLLRIIEEIETRK
jgi:hypothetical protein